MSDLFYVFGIVLVVLALVVSFLGLRSERFPDSRALYTAGLGLMGGLVVASCAFAVVLAREEAEHRELEQAEHAAEEQEGAGGETEGAQQGGGGPAEPTTADGAAVFADSGCGGCHTLADAGSTGTQGPDLDEALAGRDKAFIETSIVDPGADVAQGFGDGIMPTNFGEQLSADELAALVQYLADVAGN